LKLLYIIAALLGESMIDDGSYKDGATDPTLLCFAFALWEVKCTHNLHLLKVSQAYVLERDMSSTPFD